MLVKVKLALRISPMTDVFDSELTDLIAAAKKDLEIAGVQIGENEPDALVARAVITYCKLHFGDAAGADADRLKRSYDEQKAQLSMATGYTDWGDGDV